MFDTGNSYFSIAVELSWSVEGRLMTDVASLGVWPLGTFAWCVRPARTAPFRTRSLRAAFTNEPITPLELQLHFLVITALFYCLLAVCYLFTGPVPAALHSATAVVLGLVMSLPAK